VREVNLVLDPKPGALPFGIHMMIGKNHTTFLADTTINERPQCRGTGAHRQGNRRRRPPHGA
jgi:malate dehydrogenase (oxaloacetate-decarboxylating)(NADP+)